MWCWRGCLAHTFPGGSCMIFECRRVGDHQLASGSPRGRSLSSGRRGSRFTTITQTPSGTLTQTNTDGTIIQQLPTAKPWPLTADWSKVEDVMWDAVTAALLNTKSAKAALDDACREIDKARGVK